MSNKSVLKRSELNDSIGIYLTHVNKAIKEIETYGFNDVETEDLAIIAKALHAISEQFSLVQDHLHR